MQSLADIPRSDRCSMGFRCCFCWGIWCSAGNVCRPDTFYLLFSIYFLYTFSLFASLLVSKVSPLWHLLQTSCGVLDVRLLDLAPTGFFRSFRTCHGAYRATWILQIPTVEAWMLTVTEASSGSPMSVDAASSEPICRMNRVASGFAMAVVFYGLLMFAYVWGHQGGSQLQLTSASNRRRLRTSVLFCDLFTEESVHIARRCKAKPVSSLWRAIRSGM